MPGGLADEFASLGVSSEDRAMMQDGPKVTSGASRITADGRRVRMNSASIPTAVDVVNCSLGSGDGASELRDRLDGARFATV